MCYLCCLFQDRTVFTLGAALLSVLVRLSLLMLSSVQMFICQYHRFLLVCSSQTQAHPKISLKSRDSNSNFYPFPCGSKASGRNNPKDYGFQLSRNGFLARLLFIQQINP